MSRMVLLAASLAGLIAFSMGAAADPAAVDPVAATPATAPADPSAPDLDRIVCRTMAPVVGSRLGAKRQCTSQREWNRIRDDAQKTLARTQNNSSFGYVPLNDGSPGQAGNLTR